MKETTFICILAIAIIAGCSLKKLSEKTILGMGTDYFLYPETMNGKVKEVKEVNYWAIEKDGQVTKGNPLTWKDLDSIGSTKNFVAYFDNSGILTRYDLLNDDNTSRYSDIGTIVNGKYVKWESKQRDSIYMYAIPQYDNSGFLIGGSIYRPIKDTLVTKQVLTHDGEGNYTKIEYFNPKNQRTNYYVFTLDVEGKVLESKYYNKSDSLVFTFINGYNDKGSPIKLDANFVKSKRTSKWEMNDIAVDDHGNCLMRFSKIDDGKYKIIAERTYIYY